MNDDLVYFDGLDEAIVGIVEIHSLPRRVCYNYDKCIEIFVNQGMTYEEASEWMSHNVTTAYVGDNTPAFIYNIDE